MPANTNRPSFKQPESNDIGLWKYMDFTKFVALISSGCVFHCRSDKFKDPYEGYYPDSSKKASEAFYASLGPEMKGLVDMYYDHVNRIRQWTYISCWHASEFESAAMWDLYAKTEEAIAIKTTYGTLCSCMPDESYIGLVRYIDYKNELVPTEDIYHAFMHKRKSFEHEKEARVLIPAIPVKDLGHDLFKEFDDSKENKEVGLNIDVDLNKLIHEIYIAPDAPSWFYDLVREIVNKYNISANVIKSDLYVSPIL